VDNIILTYNNPKEPTAWQDWTGLESSCFKYAWRTVDANNTCKSKRLLKQGKAKVVKRKVFI